MSVAVDPEVLEGPIALSMLFEDSPAMDIETPGSSDRAAEEERIVIVSGTAWDCSWMLSMLGSEESWLEEVMVRSCNGGRTKFLEVSDDSTPRSDSESPSV